MIIQIRYTGDLCLIDTYESHINRLILVISSQIFTFIIQFINLEIGWFHTRPIYKGAPKDMSLYWKVYSRLWKVKSRAFQRCLAHDNRPNGSSKWCLLFLSWNSKKGDNLKINRCSLLWKFLVTSWLLGTWTTLDAN